VVTLSILAVYIPAACALRRLYVRLQVFCEVAYKAKSSKDIVAGIDEYAEDLTVLPPSVWDPAMRIEPPERPVTLVSQRYDI